MDARDTLLRALEFHGLRSWASTARVRAGLAARDALAEPYLRVVNESVMCKSCSAYDA